MLLGSGYWYYSRFIIKPSVNSTPSPEVTEAVWKTKSEKTVNEFLGYWLKTAEDNEQAKKARDLLTIVAQAKLEILKDQNGKIYSELKDKLTAFLELSGFPQSFQIISTKKIDEKTVEVSVKFAYPQETLMRIVSCVLEGNSWLIETVKDESILSTPVVSPSLSPSPSPRASLSIVSPSPTL